MSMISEQIKALRDVALAYSHNGVGMILKQAADTIEELSVKLASVNMERSAAYYNNGWIPCSEKLPEPNTLVLVSTDAGEIDTDYYGAYLKGFIGLKGTGQKAIAWRPLPESYKPEGE